MTFMRQEQLKELASVAISVGSSLYYTEAHTRMVLLYKHATLQSFLLLWWLILHTNFIQTLMDIKG